MKLTDLIKKFVESSKWSIYPPSGYPAHSSDTRAPEVVMPQELLDFYAVCGGLETIIERDEDVFLSILPPEQAVWAPAEILGHTLDKQLEYIVDDITWYWYIIGRGDTDEYFVIDLSPEQYGKCYFTTVYNFGQSGLTPIAAHSFRELLTRLLAAASVGEEWSWRERRLGDAYKQS